MQSGVHDRPAADARRTALATDLAIGAGAALLGLLPWIATGARLPLQNLWAAGTMADEMPLVLIPFSQYALGLIVSVVVTGGAIAGGAARLLRARKSERGVLAIAVGLVSVQTIALAQTAVTVRAGLVPGTPSTIYLVALVAGTIAAMLVGIGVLVLLARAPAPGVVLAVTLVAIVVGASMNGVVLPFGLSVTEPQGIARGLAQWIPAIGVGVAMAWCGFATRGRAFAVAGGLLLLWVAPAGFTAVSAAVGTRVLAAYPAEMADYAAQVFAAIIASPSESLVQPAITIVALLVGLVALRVARRRAPASIAETT